MAVDDKRYIYVTGWSSGVGTGYDYATVKHDSEGNDTYDFDIRRALYRSNRPGPAASRENTRFKVLTCIK
jgi:hypothetical protein